MSDISYTFLEMKYQSPEHAKQRALKFKNSPQVVFWGLKSETGYILLLVPSEKLFWVEFIKDNPEKSFGGIEASLEYLDHLYSSMSFSKESSSKSERSPCDSLCPECPHYTNPCKGCAATKHEITQQS